MFSPICKFASTLELGSVLARMALVWSKVLALLLLLQLARPISGLRFTVGAHLCAKRAAQPSASRRSPRAAAPAEAALSARAHLRLLLRLRLSLGLNA